MYTIKSFCSRLVPDALFLRFKYLRSCGKRLDLKSPKLFNEKLQWLKLHNRKTEYIAMVDKYEVKRIVAKTIGKQYIIPTIGVYDSFNEIDFEQLPKQFVIKCTHDSGGLVICKNKDELNIDDARKTINSCLRRNFYYAGREWPYKHVKPRIIIEKYMEDESGYQLKDYKMFCFNGVVKLIMVDSDRFSNHKRKVYDENWKQIDININYPTSEISFEKPKCLNEMIALGEKLSKSIPFVRVDFYVIKNKLYFGEITFYPGSGFQKITPTKWNKVLGDMIDLAAVKKEGVS